VDADVHRAALLHLVNPPPDMRAAHQRINADGTRCLAVTPQRPGVCRDGEPPYLRILVRAMSVVILALTSWMLVVSQESRYRGASLRVMHAGRFDHA